MYQNKNRMRIGLRQPVYLLIALLLCTIIGFLTAPHANAKEKKSENKKYAAYVVDVGTGGVIHQENANTLLHPASLTKMMTLLMLFDAIDRGRVDLDDMIPISAHAASMQPSKLGLKVGAKIKVKDAIRIIVTKSANDIAVAVGEYLGKTESGFAKLMTQKARKIGMTRTTFRNASGLHHPQQFSTAHDMAVLGYVLLTRYKRHYHYFGIKNFAYKGASYHNHNRLMESYKGMDGLKTGYIAPSGFNLVASAKRGNTRILGVVFGGKTAQSRNNKMRALLDEGFEQIQSGHDLVADAAPVIDQETTTFPVPKNKPQANTDNKKAPPEIMNGDKSQADRLAMLDIEKNESAFSRLIGEGDSDSSVRDRIQAGLIAISAHTGKPIPAALWGGAQAAEKEAVRDIPLKAEVKETQDNTSQDWSIQIGAFANRDSTDRALAQSLKKLPEGLRSAKTVIAPVHTEQGWIFRARLNGYSKDAAAKACTYLDQCIAVPPNAN